MQKTTPCLWFPGNAEEAATLYTSLLPDSRIDTIFHSPTDYPGGKAGTVLTVEFTLAGIQYLGLNAGPGHPFTDAVSFQIHTEDQAETDRLWTTLTADGGKAIYCGWLKDKFGLHWQIVPKRLTELMKDPQRAKRAMEAMMEMDKIDIAKLEQAVQGTP